MYCASRCRCSRCSGQWPRRWADAAGVLWSRAYARLLFALTSTAEHGLGSTERFPREPRQRVHRLFQPPRPVLVDVGIQRGIRAQPQLLADAQFTVAQQRQVDRQAYRQVGTDGGVQRDDRRAGSILQARGGAEDAVEDRLAVLGFTDLQVGRLRRGGYGVAERVDHVQPGPLAGDLAAEDQRGLGVDPVMAVFAVAAVHLAVHQQLPHIRGGFEQVGHVAQVGHAPLCGVAAQARHQQLGGGQVASRHQHVGCLAGIFEHVQLAMHAYIVQRGIGRVSAAKTRPSSTSIQRNRSCRCPIMCVPDCRQAAVTTACPRPLAAT